MQLRSRAIGKGRGAWRGARTTTNSGIVRHGSKGKTRGIGRGARHRGTRRPVGGLGAAQATDERRTAATTDEEDGVDPADAVAPGLSSWARKTKQTTAGPRDLPARRGGRRWPRGRWQQRRWRHSGVGRTGEGNAWKRGEVDESESEARGNRGARGRPYPPVGGVWGAALGTAGTSRSPPPGRSYRGEGDDPGRGWAGQSSWAASVFWAKGVFSFLSFFVSFSSFYFYFSVLFYFRYTLFLA